MSLLLAAFLLAVADPRCVPPRGDCAWRAGSVTETAATWGNAAPGSDRGRTATAPMSTRRARVSFGPGGRHLDPDPPSSRPSPLPPPQRGDDAWLAADKIKHFALSYAVTGFAHSGLRLVDVNPDPALAGAAVVAFGAGLGKELSDRRLGRGFSLRDLAWDLLGIGAGLVVLRRTH